MVMKNPVHPGKIVKYDCMEALGLGVTDTAKALGVSRTTLSRLVNCKSSISPEMAIRLSKAFGSTAEHWLRMQLAYDMVQMQDKADSIKVDRLPEVSQMMH